MKEHFVIGLFVLCSIHVTNAQHKHSSKHLIRPAISLNYLPTQVLDDFHGNTEAKVFLAGIHALKEIGKESYFSLGLMYGKFHEIEGDEHNGIILPIRLQKFFIPERKGFNLGFGLMMNYCKTCMETVDGAFAQEINYMFAANPVRVNVGLQTILGTLYDKAAIHVGGQVQLIWVPLKKSPAK